MANIVGPKGQVVIAKQIRDQLGVEPGWISLQRVVDDHVELYFLPPEHRRSLKGSLAKHTSVRVTCGDEWDRTREASWITAVRKEVGADRTNS